MTKEERLLAICEKVARNRIYHEFHDVDSSYSTSDVKLIAQELNQVLSVTQSQAAEIAELELTRDVHEKQMWEDGMTIARQAAEIEQLSANVAKLLTALVMIRQWDHLDTAADGQYWKDTIDEALSNGRGEKRWIELN